MSAWVSREEAVAVDVGERSRVVTASPGIAATIGLVPTHGRQRGENAPAVILCDRATALAVRNAAPEGGTGPLGTSCDESYRTTRTPSSRGRQRRRGTSGHQL